MPYNLSFNKTVFHEVLHEKGVLVFLHVIALKTQNKLVALYSSLQIFTFKIPT